MSMYHGLEVRVPFCDYRIAEYLYAIPWEYKDYKGKEKGLLRTAAEGLLPDKVLWRKKSPYPKTHNPAYLETIAARLQEVVADAKSPLHQIIRRPALETLLAEKPPIQWYGQLMSVPQTMAYFLQIEYWMRKYKVRL